MKLSDFKLFYKLIKRTFEAFFSGNGMAEFNWRGYFNFKGIDDGHIKNIYDSSTLKNSIKYELTPHELFILLAVLAPYLHPDFYMAAMTLLKKDGSQFSILGGKVKGDNKCFYPTGETVLFLLAGHDLSKRLDYYNLLDPESILILTNLIGIEPARPGSPYLSGQLFPTDELLAIIKSKKFRPEYSTNFPASRIKTRMEWEDLILPYETHEDLEELRIWMEHGSSLLGNHELGKRLKPGYRSLFYGPPGTGKTLTATLIGKNFGVDVYRVDLSMVVSKWVGETEKNLKNIFDQATNKNWVLFFDEADSLFGKRTSTNSSNDRYANQEVSYLLQRIEDFPGLIILASNLRGNIDDAFNRRFQSVIYFPMPNAEIRHILWSKAFPKEFPMEAKIDIGKVAKKYELAGGAIINIVRYCALKAMDRKSHEILSDDLEHAIIREFKKEGKIIG